MKLYIWINSGSASDFFDEMNIRMPGSSDSHSGGIVVLAENIEQAASLAKKYLDGKDPRLCNDGDDFNTDPGIDLDKPGVVIYCDGDC